MKHMYIKRYSTYTNKKHIHSTHTNKKHIHSTHTKKNIYIAHIQKRTYT